MTESILGCCEISFVIATNSKLYFGLGQGFQVRAKISYILHQTITRAVSRPHSKILFLCNLLNKASTVQIILSTTVFYVPTVKPCLKYFTTFLIKSPQTYIPPNKIMIKTITTTLQSPMPTSVLVIVSIVVKRHHDHSKSHKEATELGLAYSFRDLIHYHHGNKLGNIQADVRLEKKLRS